MLSVHRALKWKKVLVDGLLEKAGLNGYKAGVNLTLNVDYYVVSIASAVYKFPESKSEQMLICEVSLMLKLKVLWGLLEYWPFMFRIKIIKTLS